MPDREPTADIAVPPLADVPAPRSTTLPDGRRLAWYELGDPDGAPAIFAPGCPVSGISGAMYHLPARSSGVRWISIDKPGYGGSDHLPGRTLLDWAEDVRHLAGHLGLGRFAAVGESGGGPHALAVAYALPDLVTTTILIGGTRADRADREFDDDLKPTNREIFTLARGDGSGLAARLEEWRDAVSTHARAVEFTGRLHSEQRARDRAVLEIPGVMDIHAASLADAFRSGVAGAVRELQIFEGPWGFPLDGIRGEVHLWHGTDDVNVPISVAIEIAQVLRHPIRHFVEGAGHWVGQEDVRKVLALVVTAAR